LKQIKSIQQKNDLLDSKLVDLAHQQSTTSKNIQALRKANRWLVFFSVTLTLVNIGLWILYSFKF
jgi:hypothetical protein